MKIRQALSEAVPQLEASGVPDARLDAELLLAHTLGMGRMEMLLAGARELTQEQERRYSSLLLSRARREPLQYLLGVQAFYGLPIRVDARALIPRPETEELCEWALTLLEEFETPRVLDLCTGSGAIAVAIKHACPRALVSASDLSADALSLARENARENGAEIRFYEGDLWEPLRGLTFDLILSNPPYIPAADCRSLQPEVRFEPRMALDGGPDGFAFYRRIAAGAPAHLTPGGWLLMEVGLGEADGAASLLKDGFTDVTVRNDICGVARMVGARRRREGHV